MKNKSILFRIFVPLLPVVILTGLVLCCIHASYAEGATGAQHLSPGAGFSHVAAYAAEQVPQVLAGDYYVNTENDPLTIRSEANQEADKLGTIPKGQNIEITEINGHWGNTTYNGVSGWVNLNYCARGENLNPVVDETAITVHITETGECYHRAGCGYLKSDIPISLEEAERKGYRPCSRCY